MSDGTHVAGKYRLVRLLGRGGMGAVYEAVNEDTERVVALKVLHAEYAADPEILERFKLEARAGARINHPGVVEVLDFGVSADGLAYLVMERLQGESLANVLKVARRLPLTLALPLFVDVLEALVAAHAQGIVHRDLKPGNVFLTRGPQARLKLLDFGISKFSSSAAEITRTGMVLGTVTYMAPEQLRDSRSVTPAADLWAVGTMLFKTLSGQWAFNGESDSQLIARILMEEAPPLRHVVPEAPPEVDRWLGQLLQKDPSLRPRTSQALADLESLCRQLGCLERGAAVTQVLGLAGAGRIPEPAPPREATTELPSPPPVKADDVPWKVQATPLSLQPVEVATKVKLPAPIAARRRVPVPLLVAAGALGLVVLLALGLTQRPGEPEVAPPPVVRPEVVPPPPVADAPTPAPEEAPRALSVRVLPDNASLQLDGAPCANPCSVSGARGSTHHLAASAPHFLPRTLEVVLGEWEEDLVQLEPEKSPQPTPKKKSEGLEIDPHNPFH